MNISDRILRLRKLKGLSQEELADKIGVSRQAVSKWESEQSVPDADKLIILSDFFGVTTDYLLKGIENKATQTAGSNMGYNALYVGSTAFAAIGLFCAMGGWYSQQTAESIYGGMIIQAVGIAGYFIAKMTSQLAAPLAVKLLNIMLSSFMPIALTVNIVLRRHLSPYPGDIIGLALFSVAYLTLFIVCIAVYKRKRQ
ncbi:MAG: helix-turn-helix transcriptional regulator [Eubacteriaceae bacterium]|nr:helix-turn-helix transcriptional regulator [Eubacteriaceae bacterium]